MSLPLISQPGESDSVQLGQNVCVFKVKGEHTDEQFGLFELTMQPGSGGPRPHIHKQMTEIFYVVEGEVELILNEEKVIAQPGGDCIEFCVSGLESYQLRRPHHGPQEKRTQPRR